MLPLDSPRWSTLASSVGNGQESADSLAKLKPLLLNPEDPNFSQYFDELGYIVEDLDHQQSTYPATMAAMPHFVEVAEKLPLDYKIQLLSWIAMMHYDGAGRRTKKADLVKWYKASIQIAKNWNESVLTSGDKIAFYQQIMLLESAYLLNLSLIHI